MKANMVGDLLDDNILCYRVHVTDTTPVVCDVRSLDNLDGFSLQLITEDDGGGTHISGTFLVEGSNNYVSNKLPNLNQGAQVGNAKFSDITAMCSPAIVQPSGTALSQYTQVYPYVGRAMRVTFTPSGGTGYLTILYSAKGNR